MVSLKLLGHICNDPHHYMYRIFDTLVAIIGDFQSCEQLFLSLRLLPFRNALDLQVYFLLADSLFLYLDPNN